MYAECEHVFRLTYLNTYIFPCSRGPLKWLPQFYFISMIILYFLQSSRNRMNCGYNLHRSAISRFRTFATDRLYFYGLRWSIDDYSVAVNTGLDSAIDTDIDCPLYLIECKCILRLSRTRLEKYLDDILPARTIQWPKAIARNLIASIRSVITVLILWWGISVPRGALASIDNYKYYKSLSHFNYFNLVWKHVKHSNCHKFCTEKKLQLNKCTLARAYTISEWELR